MVLIFQSSHLMPVILMLEQLYFFNFWLTLKRDIHDKMKFKQYEKKVTLLPLTPTLPVPPQGHTITSFPSSSSDAPCCYTQSPLFGTLWWVSITYTVNHIFLHYSPYWKIMQLTFLNREWVLNPFVVDPSEHWGYFLLVFFVVLDFTAFKYMLNFGLTFYIPFFSPPKKIFLWANYKLNCLIGLAQAKLDRQEIFAYFAAFTNSRGLC